MELEPITLMGYRCRRCDHKWVPRVNAKAPPRVCPKCTSPYWFRERRTRPASPSSAGGQE